MGQAGDKARSLDSWEEADGIREIRRRAGKCSPGRVSAKMVIRASGLRVSAGQQGAEGREGGLLGTLWEPPDLPAVAFLALCGISYCGSLQSNP